MNHEVAATLRNILANLYPDEVTIRRVVADAGIDAARLVLNSSAINNWQAVLNEAVHARQVDGLLVIVEQEYKDNQELVTICAHYRRSTLQLTNQPQQQAVTTLRPPDEQFDLNLLKLLEVPGGASKLNDPFYIERNSDVLLREQVLKWGSTTTIRAPRQSGKTSLLVRGLNYAKQQKLATAFIDIQPFQAEQLTSLDVFLREFAALLCDELTIPDEEWENAWRGSIGPQQKLTRFLDRKILPQIRTQLLLAIDEADSLIRASFSQTFFALVRHWQSRQVSHPDPWQKLNIVMVISTEPYLLINSIEQSPFNVGERLNLADFSFSQIHDLNQRHGLPLREAALSDMMTLLGGHPYLVRKTFYEIVTKRLSWEMVQATAATDKGIFDQHLKHIYHILHDKADLKAALKTIIRTQRCFDDAALLRLLNAGIVKGRGEEYHCRCNLYERYLEHKLS